MVSRLAASVLACLVLAASPVAARAAEVQVSPVVVSLSPTTRSAIIVVRNQGQTTTRFELRVRSWEQGPTGEMVLAATEGIAVYPPVLTVAPGEERNVRVGATSEFGAVERTFRLLMDEMPPPETPDSGSQVRVVTRLSLPVFLMPAKGAAKVAFADLAARGGRVSVRLVNEGTIHVLPTSVKLAGLDGSGKAVFEIELPAWYVLAGGRRDYEATIPQDACGSLHALEVSAALPREVIRAKLARPGLCAP
jgi:fimbrial chaperone protein